MDEPVRLCAPRLRQRDVRVAEESPLHVPRGLRMSHEMQVDHAAYCRISRGALCYDACRGREDWHGTTEFGGADGGCTDETGSGRRLLGRLRERDRRGISHPALVL